MHEFFFLLMFSFFVSSWLGLSILILLILGICIFFLRCIFCSKTSKQPKGIRFLRPFSADPSETTALSPEELLEPPFDATALAGEEYDVIFIGSGISGLMGAALASQLGKKVLVLEASEKIGGMCHTFEKERFRFCPGVHTIFPEFPTWAVLQLATEGRVKLAPLAGPDGIHETLHFRRADGNVKTLTVPVGAQNWEEKLVKMFPDSESEIRQYLSDGNRARTEYDYIMLLRYIIPPYLRGIVASLLQCLLCVRIVRDLFVSTKDYLDSHFPDSPLLRFLLGRGVVLCGMSRRVPAYLSKLIAFANVQGINIGEDDDDSPSGTVYPVGGPEAIVMALVKTIRKYGGSLAVNCRVEKILVVEENHDAAATVVRGVLVRSSEGVAELRSSIVVATCGLANTFEMLPREFVPKREIVDDLVRPSMFFLHTFLGFDASAEEVGMPHSGLMTLYLGKEGEDFEEDSDVDMLAFDATTPHGARFALFYSGDSVHSNVNEDGRKLATAQLLVQVDCSHFEQWKDFRLDCRGSEYVDLKESIAEPFLEFLFQQYPKMREHMVLRLTGTSLSTKHWILWPHGEVYGVENSSRRIFELWDKCLLPPMEQVKGLVISGVDSMLSASVGDAVLSGAISLMDIVPEVDLFAELPFAMEKRIRDTVGVPFVKRGEIRDELL